MLLCFERIFEVTNNALQQEWQADFITHANANQLASLTWRMWINIFEDLSGLSYKVPGWISGFWHGYKGSSLFRGVEVDCSFQIQLTAQFWEPCFSNSYKCNADPVTISLCLNYHIYKIKIKVLVFHYILWDVNDTVHVHSNFSWHIIIV